MEEQRRYQQWLASVRGKQLAIIGLGAGTALATIRWLAKKLTAAEAQRRTTLVRMNPDASDADEPAVPVRMTALEALRRIEEKLPESFKSAAKVGLRIDRTNGGGAAGQPEGRLEAASARDLQMLDFDVAPVSKPGRPACGPGAASSDPISKSVTWVISVPGHVAPLNSRHQRGGPEGVRRTLACCPGILRAAARGGWLRRVRDSVSAAV